MPDWPDLGSHVRGDCNQLSGGCRNDPRDHETAGKIVHPIPEQLLRRPVNHSVRRLDLELLGKRRLGNQLAQCCPVPRTGGCSNKESRKVIMDLMGRVESLKIKDFPYKVRKMRSLVIQHSQGHN